MLKSLIPQPLINYLYHLPQALAANLLTDFPSKTLQVIGVTGTDGKTTTSTGIHHLLQTSGKEAALISTVKAVIKDHEYDTGFHVTTPNTWQLQKWIKQVKDQNINYLVQEATSHGLDQFRLWGVHFDIGVITNITNEHLDYHKTYHNYLHAKAKLFDNVKFAILNADDQSYQPLLKYIQRRNPTAQILAYGIKKTPVQVRATDIKTTTTGTTFQLTLSSHKPTTINLPLLGQYNISNALAVATTGYALGLNPATIKQALESYPPIPGRMEIISQKPTIIVDFAHTPNALENALETLHSHFGCHPELVSGSSSKGKTRKSARASGKDIPRLISIFGCAGLRDHAKRPVMGEISGKYADITILTAEDPRTEDVNQIIEEIAQGCLKSGAKEIISSSVGTGLKPILTNQHIFLRIPDRQQAINTALELATKNDTIGIFGKGHEQTMCFGTTEYPWSDQEAVKGAIS